jgi:hypothetical protein
MTEKTYSPTIYAVPLYGFQHRIPIDKITVNTNPFENPRPPEAPAASRNSIAREVFGDLDPKNFDPQVWNKLYESKTQEATTLFETRLKGLLGQAGLDSNEKFSFQITADGRAVIEGSDKVKAAFQRAIEQDPVLLKDMEGAAVTNDTVARTRVTDAYAREWFLAMPSGKQDEVWSKFRPRFAELEQNFNKVSYAEGRLSFASIDYARQILNTPS